MKNLTRLALLILSIVFTLQVGAAGPSLSVNVSQDRAPISPLIYGMNYADPVLGAELHLPLNRWGGNDTSRYSYLLDTSGKGFDYYFSVIPYRVEYGIDDPLPDNSTVNRYIEQNAAWGGETLITVPMLGWMPKQEAYLCGFPKSRFPDQQAFEPWRGQCGNGITSGGVRITNPVASDSSVAIGTPFVTGWVNYLVNRYGSANNGGIRFYAMDNEPYLWNDTHRDVRTTPLSYDEHRDLTYAYAAAVKAADPNALIMAPSDFGWTAYFYSALDASAGGAWWNNPQDRLAHGNVPFIEWYLQQMQAYETANGIRLLDYVDEHFYPQNGVSLNENVDAATAALRLRSTRALWDPTYLDESWIADEVMLIPRMKQWVTNNYPGTKTAISEYNWGGLSHINGALAQADVLGIFGREGLDLATIWDGPSASEPGAYAFRMYLNYDGQGSTFGDTRVRAVSTDQATLSVYAAERSTDGAITIIVINKSFVAQNNISLSLAGFTPEDTAEVWRYSSANLSQIVSSSATLSGSSLTMSYPADSITLLEICPAGSGCDEIGVPTPVPSVTPVTPVPSSTPITPVPSATPVTPVPSLTPIPSSTPLAELELIANSEFIQDGVCTLSGWTFSNPTTDKLVGTLAKPKGAFDHCAVQFTGTAGSTAKLTTQANLTGVVAGDVLRLSGWLNGKNVSTGGAIIANITYAGGTKAKLRVPVRAGTYPYEFQSQSLTLAALPTQIKVFVQMRSGSGRFFVDNIHLMTNPTARLGLPPTP